MGRPGPDRGEGGKYLIVPAGYDGPTPDGYFVPRVYPLSEADAPPATEFISFSEKEFNTIHANDVSFFDELDGGWSVRRSRGRALRCRLASFRRQPIRSEQRSAVMEQTVRRQESPRPIGLLSLAVHSTSRRGEPCSRRRD